MKLNQKPLNREFVVETLKELPPFSSAITDLLKMLDENNTDMSAVAVKLLVDPILAGRVLHIANSSFYGFSRQIGTVQEACVILGNHTVRNLIYTLVVMGQFKNTTNQPSEERYSNVRTVPDELTVDYQQVWQHSLMVGCLGMRLAEGVECEQEIAFTAGLFQELGIIILHHFFTKQYDECITWSKNNSVCLIDAEREFFGMDHFDISALGLETWNFPNTIIDVLKHMSDLNSCDSPLPNLIRICDVMACGLGIEPINHLPLSAINDEILRNSQLDLNILQDQLTPCRILFSDLSAQLIA